MNGVLLVDKPIGPTSHDIVAQVRRCLGIRGIGHAGTLDPLASGLLVLLVGEATKISDYLLNGDKGYDVTVELGRRTDSMDSTGEVLYSAPESRVAQLEEHRVRETVESMSGTLKLAVPVHSAVKVNGKRLYEFAHRGEEPESVPIREMTFSEVQFLRFQRSEGAALVGPIVSVRLRSSKGSFIRSWGDELGRRLDVGGTVTALRRIMSQPFRVEDALTLEELDRQWGARRQRDGSSLGGAWIPLAEALPHFGRVDIDGQDVRLIRNGQISKGVQAELLRQIKLGEAPRPVRVIDREEGRLLALLTAQPGEFYKIRRVFAD